MGASVTASRALINGLPCKWRGTLNGPRADVLSALASDLNPELPYAFVLKKDDATRAIRILDLDIRKRPVLFSGRAGYIEPNCIRASGYNGVCAGYGYGQANFRREPR